MLDMYCAIWRRNSDYEPQVLLFCCLLSEVLISCFQTKPQDKAPFRKLPTEKSSNKDVRLHLQQPQAVELGSVEASSILESLSYSLFCLLDPPMLRKDPTTSSKKEIVVEANLDHRHLPIIQQYSSKIHPIQPTKLSPPIPQMSQKLNKKAQW